MAQGNGTAASEAASVVASTGNSLLQHMNFRGHEGEPVNQEQPEHILGKFIFISVFKKEKKKKKNLLTARSET